MCHSNLKIVSEFRLQDQHSSTVLINTYVSLKSLYRVYYDSVKCVLVFAFSIFAGILPIQVAFFISPKPKY